MVDYTMIYFSMIKMWVLYFLESGSISLDAIAITCIGELTRHRDRHNMTENLNYKGR